MRAAANALAASVVTAESLAAVHVCCRKTSPLGSSHVSESFAMAAAPSGDWRAGPLTSIVTFAIRVGSPGTTVSVTVAGCVARSTATSTDAEKKPWVAAASRACGTASRTRRAKRSSVMSANSCQRMRSTAPRSVASTGAGATTVTR